MASLNSSRDAALDQRVGLHVDGAGRLVEDQDLGARDDGARQAEQLALALREVEAALADLAVQALEQVGVVVQVAERGRAAARRGRLVGDEVDAAEGVAQLVVRVVVEGVEVASHGAGEEDGVLWDDGQSAPEIVQFDLADV